MAALRLSHWNGVKLVARTGFEPVISTLRGSRVREALIEMIFGVGMLFFPLGSGLLSRTGWSASPVKGGDHIGAQKIPFPYSGANERWI